MWNINCFFTNLNATIELSWVSYCITKRQKEKLMRQQLYPFWTLFVMVSSQEMSTTKHNEISGIKGILKIIKHWQFEQTKSQERKRNGKAYLKKAVYDEAQLLPQVKQTQTWTGFIKMN